MTPFSHFLGLQHCNCQKSITGNSLKLEVSVVDPRRTPPYGTFTGSFEAVLSLVTIHWFAEAIRRGRRLEATSLLIRPEVPCHGVDGRLSGRPQRPQGKEQTPWLL